MTAIILLYALRLALKRLPWRLCLFPYCLMVKSLLPLFIPKHVLISILACIMFMVIVILFILKSVFIFADSYSLDAALVILDMYLEISDPSADVSHIKAHIVSLKEKKNSLKSSNSKRYSDSYERADARKRPLQDKLRHSHTRYK